LSDNIKDEEGPEQGAKYHPAVKLGVLRAARASHEACY